MANIEHIHVYLLFFCCLSFKGCLCATSISVDKCGFPGESVSLSCTLPAAEFLPPLAWSNNIIVGDISTCLTTGCNTPTNGRYATSANTTGIYLTITSLTRADDETTWNCKVQGTISQSLNLVVRDHPSTCVLSENTDGSYKCETDCGYPTSDLTIDWFVGSVDLATNPPITTAPTGCSSGGKASATFPASDISVSGDLQCKCGMQSTCPEKALIVSNSMLVTGTTTPTPTATPTCRCSRFRIPCDWECYYLYIIIAVVAVLLVLLVISVCCCYRHGYCTCCRRNRNRETYDANTFNARNMSNTENGRQTDTSKRHEHTAM